MLQLICQFIDRGQLFLQFLDMSRFYLGELFRVFNFVLGIQLTL